MFDFGAHLKGIRKAKGMTQKQLAQAIGASESGIQNYELGTRKPTYDMLIALAAYFEVPIDYLTGSGIYGKLEEHPEIKSHLAESIDTLIGENALKQLHIESTSNLSDSDFCQLAASLIKDFSVNGATINIYWKI